MTIVRPEWMDYAVYSEEDGYPVIVGFKKDTPKEIIEQFKKDQEEYAKALEEGIIL